MSVIHFDKAVLNCGNPLSWNFDVQRSTGSSTAQGERGTGCCHERLTRVKSVWCWMLNNPDKSRCCGVLKHQTDFTALSWRLEGTRHTISLGTVLEGMFTCIYNIFCLYELCYIKAAIKQASRSINCLLVRLYDWQLPWLALVSSSMLVAVGFRNFWKRTASPATSHYVQLNASLFKLSAFRKRVKMSTRLNYSF